MSNYVWMLEGSFLYRPMVIKYAYLPRTSCHILYITIHNVEFLEDKYICAVLQVIHILLSNQFVSLCVGEACWWTIHPASKQRSEGEKVRVGDDLILVSISSERYLVSIRFTR